MIDTQRLLKAIDRKVKVWEIHQTFDNPLDAKRLAIKLFVEAAGVLVAPYTGNTYTVFSWTKEVLE